MRVTTEAFRLGVLPPSPSRPSWRFAMSLRLRVNHDLVPTALSRGRQASSSSPRSVCYWPSSPGAGSIWLSKRTGRGRCFYPLGIVAACTLSSTRRKPPSLRCESCGKPLVRSRNRRVGTALPDLSRGQGFTASSIVDLPRRGLSSSLSCCWLSRSCCFTPSPDLVHAHLGRYGYPLAALGLFLISARLACRDSWFCIALCECGE